MAKRKSRGLKAAELALIARFLADHFRYLKSSANDKAKHWETLHRLVKLLQEHCEELARLTMAKGKRRRDLRRPTMANPEYDWKQGDAVWCWDRWAACWLAGVIHAVDRPCLRALVAERGGVLDCRNAWFHYNDLRPRDPALKGEDNRRGRARRDDDA